MEIQYGEKLIEFSNEFSQKNLSIPFVDIPDETFIYASSFYQENMPRSHVFRDDMKGVKFYNCNLDNCFIPEGNELVECSNKSVLTQNDLNDWIIDDEDNPVKPTNYSVFLKFKLPVPLPEDIPHEKVDRPINLRIKAENTLQENIKNNIKTND